MRRIFFFVAIFLAMIVIFKKNEAIKPSATYSPILSPPVTSPRPLKPPLYPNVQGIIEAGNQYPGANVCKSEIHPLLMSLAKEHAQYMASTGVQGHQGFNARFQRISQSGLGSAAEICAESWSWQANESELNLWIEAFSCWRQSLGHWRIAQSKHKYFGFGKDKGSNGVWYYCIIVVD